MTLPLLRLSPSPAFSLAPPQWTALRPLGWRVLRAQPLPMARLSSNNSRSRRPPPPASHLAIFFLLLTALPSSPLDCGRPKARPRGSRRPRCSKPSRRRRTLPPTPSTTVSSLPQWRALSWCGSGSLRTLPSRSVFNRSSFCVLVFLCALPSARRSLRLLLPSRRSLLLLRLRRAPLLLARPRPALLLAKTLLPLPQRRPPLQRPLLTSAATRPPTLRLSVATMLTTTTTLSGTMLAKTPSQRRSHYCTPRTDRSTRPPQGESLQPLQQQALAAHSSAPRPPSLALSLVVGS